MTVRNLSVYNKENVSDPEVETLRTVMLQTLINPLRTNHRPHNLSDAWRSDKNQHRQHNKSNPLSLQNEPAQQKTFV